MWTTRTARSGRPSRPQPFTPRQPCGQARPAEETPGTRRAEDGGQRVLRPRVLLRRPRLRHQVRREARQEGHRRARPPALQAGVRGPQEAELPPTSWRSTATTRPTTGTAWSTATPHCATTSLQGTGSWALPRGTASRSSFSTASTTCTTSDRFTATSVSRTSR